MIAGLLLSIALGTSQPVLVTLGDSITAGANGSEYPRKLGTLIDAARVVNLGIPGQFSGPVDYQIPKGPHMVYAGVLAAEVPKIPPDATIVTLYIGTNDMWLAQLKAQADPGDVLCIYAHAAQTYRANVDAIVGGIRSRVPHARLVVADVPNPADRPVHLTEDPLLRAAQTGFADSMRRTLLETGATFVDLECDPAMYDDANFGGPYDVHPIDAGFERIAQDFAQALRHAAPAGSCVYETDAPRLDGLMQR